MKINSIIPVNTQQTQQKMSLAPIKYNDVPLHKISLNNLPSSTLGRSMVSFRGEDFEQTLTENYFKLPEGCKPDEYQTKAAESIYNSHDTLVTAPTGTGKTAIAYYAISKNLKDGKKTFYTAPLKALSNEKYKQLQLLYGKENVGLLTGDIKINTDAPIVVMTTEIYRNMVFGDKFKEKSTQLKDLKTVIFDELHYLGDVDRGGVWEQSIVLSDKNTQLLSLSATIGNNQEINDWMSKIRPKQIDLINVPPEKRHVPLVFENIPVAAKGNSGNLPKTQSRGNGKNLEPPISMKSYLSIVSKLKKEDKLPAILFVFSKKDSRHLLEKFKREGLPLTSEENKKEIQSIVDKYKREGKYLGESLDFEALEKGYVIHNAGFLPDQKELVEELFQKKLVKVVIATETLSAGINMPTRTVVISATTKPSSDEGKRQLTPNEFHQMAGRAGRRGIDTIGYVNVMSTNKEQSRIFQSLIKSKPNDIKSHFSPDYSFITGYYKATQNDELIKETLHKSLQAYDSDSDIAKTKLQALMKIFEDKKEILKNFGFMAEDNILTPKGELLSSLNGYEQIPIIDMIHKQKLLGMTPAELAACVGSLVSANKESRARVETQIKAIESEVENKVNIDETEQSNLRINQFVDDFNEYLDDYNEKMSKDPKFKKVAQDESVPKHLYAWADLNSRCEDSVLNWKTFYNNFKKGADEGGLFKEITRTVDLLKQISEIAETGLKLPQTEQDKAYYSGLKSNAKEAMELLSKKPIQEVFSCFSHSL